jgi:hypothetical protein
MLPRANALPRAQHALLAGIVLAQLVLPSSCVTSTITESSSVTPQKCFNASKVPQPFRLPKLRVQWDAWETSQLTTSAAAIILREKLGFDVEFVTGVSPRNMYAKLAEGEIHLAFEAWPASNPAQFNEYATADSKTGKFRVQSHAYTNLFGRSGLFEACDRYGGSNNPCRNRSLQGTDALLKDAMQDPMVQEHFTKDRFEASATEQWYPKQCTNAGVDCSAQVLHISKTGYDEGQVEALLETLGIPAHVAYVGAEAHTHKIWESYTKRVGTLLYSYSPNANQEGVSILSLPRAQIDPKLDFRPQLIHKLSWPGLSAERGGDAVAFMQGFNLGEQDYAQMASFYDRFRDPQRAACAWVQENADKWEHLVRFPERDAEPFFCVRRNDGLCDYWYQVGWSLFFIQIFFVLVLFASAHRLKQDPPAKTNHRSDLDNAIAQARAAQSYSSVLNRQQSFAAKLSKSFKGNYHTRESFLNGLEDVPRCLTHVRTLKSFVALNTDAACKDVPTGGDDRWIAELNRASLMPYLFLSASDGMLPVLIDCLALSFVSGSVATYFYLVVYHQTFQKDFHAFELGTPWMDQAGFYQTITNSNSAFRSLIDAFKFFPSFLQIGFLGYAVNRWRLHQEATYNLMGALHNAALVVGSSITAPNSTECKHLAFQVYRYLTTVHILNYKNVNKHLEALEWRDFVALGLLTPKETEILGAVALVAQRETLVGWIARDMYEGVKDNWLCHKVKCTLATDIRGWIGGFQALCMVGQPNLWSALMKFVVDLLILMFVVGNPFTGMLRV